jgi:hypothetical protein
MNCELDFIKKSMQRAKNVMIDFFASVISGPQSLSNSGGGGAAPAGPCAPSFLSLPPCGCLSLEPESLAPASLRSLSSPSLAAGERLFAAPRCGGRGFRRLLALLAGGDAQRRHRGVVGLAPDPDLFGLAGGRDESLFDEGDPQHALARQQRLGRGFGLVPLFR